MLDFYQDLLVCYSGSLICWSKWSGKLKPKQMNLGDPIETIIFNLAQSFRRNVNQFDYLTIGFRFAFFCAVIWAQTSEKKVTQELARTLLLHLLLKGKFLWRSFPDIVINKLNSPNFFKTKTKKYICLLQQPA